MRKQFLLFFVLTSILFLTLGCLNKKTDSQETNISQTSDSLRVAPSASQIKALTDYWLSFDEAHKNLSSSTYAMPTIDSLPFFLFGNPPLFTMYDPLNGSTLGVPNIGGYSDGALNQSAVFSAGNHFIRYGSGYQMPASGTIQFYIFLNGYSPTYPNPLNWIITQAEYGGASVGDIQLMFFYNNTLVYSQYSIYGWNYMYTSALPLHQWVKITVVYGTSSGMLLWINDQLAVSDTNRKIPLSSRPLYFGYPGDAFRGRLDEVVTYYGTPEVKIVTPASGAVFLPTDEIAFYGFGLNLSWARDGVPIGSGNIVKTVLPAGTHTITLSGQTALGQTDSDNITITVQDEVSEIKIKNLDVFPGLDPFADTASVSYRAAKTRFQAIGYRADGTEISEPLKVTWTLVGGDASGTLRNGILDLLNSNVGKIGVFSTSVATYSSVSDTEIATFVSLLPGNINLKATAQNGVSKVISIRIKQPTVYLKFNLVDGAGAATILPIWKDIASNAWGIENLIKIKFENEVPEVFSNASFSALSSEESNEYQLIGFGISLLPDLLRIISLDTKANEKYGNRANIFTRQLEELLGRNRGSVSHITVTITDDLFAVGSINPITRWPVLTFGGWTAAQDNSFKRQMVAERIEEASQAGIAIRQIEPNSSGEFLDSEKVTLAHEVGHMLIQFGDEHTDNNASWPINNLMNLGATKISLEPKQFIQALRLDGRPPSFFIVEE